MSGTLVLAAIGERAELAALVEDRRVTDWVFGPCPGPAPEAVYKAKVERPVPGAGAVFVSLGQGKGHGQGQARGPSQGYVRDARGLKPGAVLLVEATSIAEPDKAVPVSPRVLYRQRYSIHTPGAPGVNVARGIVDAEERARLQTIVEAHIGTLDDWLARRGDERPDEAARIRRVLEAHATGGTILRSAAAGEPGERIARDLDLAVAARLTAEERLADRSVPLGLVSPGPLPREFALREWGERIGRIAIGPGLDALPAEEEARLSPLAGRIDRMPDPFDQFGVWEQIERMRKPDVDLPSGGWMAVEPTRAMVTVDVNTGAEFSPGAAVTANVESARELPRQLRLRGLGGHVAIDFAPLKKAERRRVEDTLKSAFRRDPVETTLAGWTPLGHFELQRKRERRPIGALFALVDRQG
jgi:ribonuclease G